MKGSKFIFGAFLTIALSVGVGVGLGTQKQAKKAEAAPTTETTFYIDVTNATWGASNFDETRVYLWNSSDEEVKTYIWWEDSTDKKGSLSTATYLGTTYVTFTIDERSSYGYDKFIVYAWNMNGKGNQTVDILFSDTSDGQNLITLANTGWDNKNTITWGTLNIPTPRTITKYAVVDGVKESEPIGSSSVASGETYATPDAIIRAGYHFGGWFKNEACTNSWDSAEPITADTPIYAKYTSLVVDSYFYWTDKDSTDITHVYFFGEYAPVAWPGTALSTYLVGSDLSLNGEGNLYKIPVPSVGEYQFVLNNNNNVKTGDTSVELESCLYTNYSDYNEGIYWYNTSWSDVAAKAADFVLEVEEFRKAVTAGGNILAESVCGISAGDAADLYNEYLTLGDSTSMVNKTTITTYSGKYDGEHVPADGTIAYSTIMQQLRAIAVKGGQTVNDAYRFANAQVTTNTTTIVIVTISSVSALALGVFFVLKRKKQD